MPLCCEWSSSQRSGKPSWTWHCYGACACLAVAALGHSAAQTPDWGLRYTTLLAASAAPYLPACACLTSLGAGENNVNGFGLEFYIETPGEEVGSSLSDIKKSWQFQLLYTVSQLAAGEGGGGGWVGRGPCRARHMEGSVVESDRNAGGCVGNWRQLLGDGAPACLSFGGRCGRPLGVPAQCTLPVWQNR